MLGDESLFHTLDLSFEELHMMVCQEIDWITTRCPIDKQGDLAKLQVSYIPRRRVIEVLSLDDWTQTMHATEIYTEDVAHYIFEFLWVRLEPRYLELASHLNTRFGASLYINRAGDEELESFAAQRRLSWTKQTAWR